MTRLRLAPSPTARVLWSVQWSRSVQSDLQLDQLQFDLLFFFGCCWRHQPSTITHCYLRLSLQNGSLQEDLSLLFDSCISLNWMCSHVISAACHHLYLEHVSESMHCFLHLQACLVYMCYHVWCCFRRQSSMMRTGICFTALKQNRVPNVDLKYGLAYKFGVRSTNWSFVIGRWLRLLKGKYTPIAM